MQLVQAGRLRLDDTAGHWVTFLVDDDSPLAGVTVRDLLTHASGVYRDSADGDFWHLVGAFPDRARLREILAEPAAAVVPPNERFKYSNIGYGLLGLIIEAVTGSDFNDHLIEAVVRPLGVTDLGPELVTDRLGDYAVGYSSLAYADTRTPIEHVDTEHSRPPPASMPRPRT